VVRILASFLSGLPAIPLLAVRTRGVNSLYSSCLVDSEYRKGYRPPLAIRTVWVGSYSKRKNWCFVSGPKRSTVEGAPRPRNKRCSPVHFPELFFSAPISLFLFDSIVAGGFFLSGGAWWFSSMLFSPRRCFCFFFSIPKPHPSFLKTPLQTFLFSDALRSSGAVVRRLLGKWFNRF